MSGTPQQTISDLQCPVCVAENDALGDGVGYADCYFNWDEALWAVCGVHQVRWYVTRELTLVDENKQLRHPDPETARQLPEVEGIFRDTGTRGPLRAKRGGL
jgi:hypothetical protein